VPTFSLIKKVFGNVLRKKKKNDALIAFSIFIQFLKLPFFFFPLFQMYRSVYIDNFLKKVKKSSQEENARVLASLFAYTEKHVDQLVAQNVKVIK
jgi:hypothetical protein